MYGALINGWARHANPDAGEKAEKILRSWIERADSGELLERPKVVAFTATMKAYTNSGVPRAMYNVDEVFSLLLREYEGGNENAKPDSKLFSAILRALAYSHVPHKLEAARTAIKLMKQYNIPPDSFKIHLLKEICEKPKAVA